MKRRQFSLAKLFGLLTLVSIGLLAWLNYWPEPVARQRCVQAGWESDQLHWTKLRFTHWPILSRATVRYSVAGNDVELRVELRQTVLVLPWRVVDFEEVPVSE